MRSAASSFRVAASSTHRINLDLPPSEDGGDGRSFSTISSRSSDCSMCFSLSPGQRLSLSERAALDRAVREAYIEVGITEDPDTHTAAAHDDNGSIGAGRRSRSRERKDDGSQPGRAPGRVHHWQPRRRTAGRPDQRFARQPPAVVFGLQELPEDLWSFATYLVADLCGNSFDGGPDGSVCWWSTRPGCCCSTRAGARFLESVARLARSYGLGLVFVTQDIKNVLSDARGSVVVDNLFTTLLLRQSSKGQQFGQQTHRLVADHFGLSSAEQRLLAEARPGEGLLLVGPWRCPPPVIASPGEARVAMSAPRERQALAARAVARGGAE